MQKEEINKSEYTLWIAQNSLRDLTLEDLLSLQESVENEIEERNYLERESDCV